jgi:hypothetical protein
MNVMHIDNAFPQQMLPVCLESGQQGIHDVRQVVGKTKLHALWEDTDDEEPGWGR